MSNTDTPQTRIDPTTVVVSGAVLDAVGPGAVASAYGEAEAAFQSTDDAFDFRDALLDFGFGYDEATVIAADLYPAERTCALCGNLLGFRSGDYCSTRCVLTARIEGADR